MLILDNLEGKKSFENEEHYIQGLKHFFLCKFLGWI